MHHFCSKTTADPFIPRYEDKSLLLQLITVVQNLIVNLYSGPQEYVDEFIARQRRRTMYKGTLPLSLLAKMFQRCAKKLINYNIETSISVLSLISQTLIRQSSLSMVHGPCLDTKVLFNSLDLEQTIIHRRSVLSKAHILIIIAVEYIIPYELAGRDISLNIFMISISNEGNKSSMKPTNTKGFSSLNGSPTRETFPMT